VSDSPRREMTGRELAEAILAMPDPDSAICVSMTLGVVGGALVQLPDAMLMAVRQGLDDDLVLSGQAADAHFIVIDVEIERI
jgi:hypothetical protein